MATWAKNLNFFLLPFHLAPLLGVTPVKFMEKLYRSWNQCLPCSRRWRFGDPSLDRFWLIHQWQTDGRTDRTEKAKPRYSSSCCRT